MNDSNVHAPNLDWHDGRLGHHNNRFATHKRNRGHRMRPRSLKKIVMEIMKERFYLIKARLTDECHANYGQSSYKNKFIHFE